MKITLLSLIFIIFLSLPGYSQNIDIVGKGIHGKSNAVLTISPKDELDSVQVFVATKGLYSFPPDDGVLFDNGADKSSVWKRITGDYYLSSSNDESIGTYSRSFSEIRQVDFNATIQSQMAENVHSFYAFSYTNKLTSLYKSYSDTNPTFMYHNGSDNAFSYNIAIHESLDYRKAYINIPISELDETTRNVVINISSNDGAIDQTFVENTYNLGNSFLLLKYEIINIPAKTRELTITIYSPDPDQGEGKGDSFIVGGVIVDVEKDFYGCTYTQGYWKNHSDCRDNKPGKGPKRDPTWDKLPEAENTLFFLSEQTYCEAFATNPGKGGKYYILAHQYMAAELNLLNDANPADIVNVFDKATRLLKKFTPEQVAADKDLQNKFVNLAGSLDKYNNGITGPGHCDENEQEDEVSITPIKQSRKKIMIYPNPTQSLSKLSFTPKHSGAVMVNLYNINGVDIGTFYRGKARKDTEMTIEIDASVLSKGIYFAVIRNGSDVHREKISVIR